MKHINSLQCYSRLILYDGCKKPQKKNQNRIKTIPQNYDGTYGWGEEKANTLCVTNASDLSKLLRRFV